MIVYVSIVLLIVAVVFVFISERFVNRPTRDRRLCQEFGLSPEDYRVVATDLGGDKRKLFLRSDNVVGVPDVVFVHRQKLDIVVGELKSRTFSRKPSVTPYEYNQVQLYLGLAERHYKIPCRAVLRYACGHIEQVSKNPTKYRDLIKLVPNLRSHLSSFSH